MYIIFQDTEDKLRGAIDKLHREERQADKRARALEQMLEEAGREKGEAEVKLSGFYTASDLLIFFDWMDL